MSDRFAMHAVSKNGLTLAAIALALSLVSQTAAATQWSEVRSPSPGVPQTIGSASNGCLGGAQELPETGVGYVSIRRYRNRYYGHPELLRFVEDVGRAQQRRRDNALMQVGDLSQPRGGRMSSSHRSHQNGLDVDIWFTLAKSVADAQRQMDHADDPQSMVQPDGLSFSAAWGEDQRFLLETAARHPAVDRIFVNPAIKRELCRRIVADRGWLRKVRPWKGHDAHFHVRLSCPPSSSQCNQQAVLPTGDGCGEELAWWFTEEAHQPIEKAPDLAASEPAPLAACQAILQ